MEIETKPFGSVEIEEDKVLTIKEGLLGFEGKERYALIGREEEQPFEWLQSVEDPTLAFVVCQASAIIPDYQLSMLQEDFNDLDSDDEDNLSIYLIVVVPDNPSDMTVNMKGPVIINERTFVGKQIINQVEEYGVRHRLLDEVDDESQLKMASGES